MRKIACLATMQGRERQLEQAIASLLPQVDELWVWINGQLVQSPSLLRRCRVPTGPDRGDAGKFFATWSGGEQSDFMFTCDDDLVYPADYVQTLTAALEEQERHAGRPVAVGVHAAQFRRIPPHSYRGDRMVRHCLHDDGQGVRREHMLGTGTLAFKRSAIRLREEHFENGIMADVWFALQAQIQEVPLRSVPRATGWIVPAQPAPTDTLWNRMRKEGDRVQVAALQRVRNWKLW